MKRFLPGLLAATLIALTLFAAALALSPDLHLLLHGDAGEQDHQCAATLLIDGLVDQPDSPAVAAPHPLSREEGAPLSPHAERARTLCDDLADGRAPPCA